MNITILKDGPILVKNGESTPLALCRCGESENKPFCDGKHKEAGFTAETVEIQLEAQEKCCDSCEC